MEPIPSQPPLRQSRIRGCGDRTTERLRRTETDIVRHYDQDVWSTLRRGHCPRPLQRIGTRHCPIEFTHVLVRRDREDGTVRPLGCIAHAICLSATRDDCKAKSPEPATPQPNGRPQLGIGRTHPATTIAILGPSRAQYDSHVKAEIDHVATRRAISRDRWTHHNDDCSSPVHGLISAIPAWTKSFVLRVAQTASLDRQMAAIWASPVAIGRPAASRTARTSA